MKWNRALPLCAAVLVACAALALAFWPDAGDDEDVNLIENSGFELLTDDGRARDWAADMWYWDVGVSNLALSDDAYAGQHSVLVENIGENDARFSQRIAVRPNTYYVLRVMVKAEDCGQERAGATVSIENTFASSASLYDTAGEWVQVELYGKTGADQTSMVVMARVGGYGSLNTGRAWFDEVEARRIDALPAGAVEYSFAPQNASEEERDHTSLILLVAFAFALAALGVLWRLHGGQDAAHALERAPRQGACAALPALLWGMLLIGLVVRIAVGRSIRGYGVDMTCFESWSERMAGVGPLGFYAEGYFCDYPPGYIWVLGMLGALRQLLGIGYDTSAHWMLIKLVPIACDLIASALLYRQAETRLGRGRALLLSGIYLFNPMTILNSAAWGQVDSVLSLCLIVCVVSAVEGKWSRALPAYVLAVLVKPQALMFGPIGLFALVVAFSRADSAAEGRRLFREVALGLGIALAGALLLIAPFAIAKERPFQWLFTLYGNTLSHYSYITVNACNLYTLLGMNWRPLAEVPALAALAWGLLALAFLYVFLLYLKSRRPSALFLSGAIMLVLAFAFGAQMHERYMFPALLLIAFAYALERDARLFAALALLSITQFVNVALVLQDEHLIAAHLRVNQAISVANLLAAALLVWTGWDLLVRNRVRALALPQKLRAALASRSASDRAGARWPDRPRDARLRLRPIDYALMLSVTILYAALAFFNLGATSAPQTTWTSGQAGETVTFDLGQSRTFHMAYYGNICNSSFTVSFSDDGQVWTEEALAIYNQGEIFRWLWFVPAERNEKGEFERLDSVLTMYTARYARISAEQAGLQLSEIGFLDDAGAPYAIASAMSAGGVAGVSDPGALIDEQGTIPPYPSYYNSSYFDEIYHGRTAYENLNGLWPYEYTHPPLGKVLIMLGVRLFGMTPFGWRFMGTLFGVLMLPLMYLLVKQLMKKTQYAFIGMFLLAVDCMHFTQTRIATIDTYGVFFILAMYLFMLRYCQMSFYHQRFWRTLVPLALSGLCMGLGIASKWIGIYAAVGLAVMLFYTLYLRYAEHEAARESRGSSPAELRAREKFWRYLFVTLGLCCAFFLLVPSLIYYGSYYWFMVPKGGLSVQGVWAEQVRMYEYHATLVATHPFMSPWYEWPLIAKPMWYYSGNEFMPEGIVSSISCMGNPVVWWGGLLCLILAALRLFKTPGDRRLWFVLLGFAAQYVPWMLVSRCTFIYHYFASVPFIILCTVLMLEYVQKRWPALYRPLTAVYLAGALALFVAFYPLMSGMPVARSYAMYLRWFNWYNF